MPCFAIRDHDSFLGILKQRPPTLAALLRPFVFLRRVMTSAVCAPHETQGRRWYRLWKRRAGRPGWTNNRQGVERDKRDTLISYLLAIARTYLTPLVQKSLEKVLGENNNVSSHFGGPFDLDPRIS